MHTYQFSIRRRGGKWTVGLHTIDAKTRVDAKKEAMKFIKKMNKNSNTYVFGNIWRK